MAVFHLSLMILIDRLKNYMLNLLGFLISIVFVNSLFNVVEPVSRTRVYSLFSYVLIFSLPVVFVLRDFYEIKDALVYMDYFREYDDFYSIFNGSYSWKGDYSFFFFGWLTKLFIDSPMSYMAFFYYINCFFALLFLYKISCKMECHYHLLLFLSFFCSSSFYFLYGNVVRQGMAFSFFLLFVLVVLSFKGWVRIILGVIVFLVAIYSHKSVIVLFCSIALFFAYKKKSMFTLLVLGVLLTIVFKDVLLFVMNVFFGEYSMLRGKIEDYASGDASSNITSKFVISFLGLSFVSMRRHFLELNGSKEAVVDLLTFAAISCFLVAILTFGFGKMTTRFLLYVDILISILLPVIFCLKLRSGFLNGFSELVAINFYSIVCLLYGGVILMHPSLILLFP